MAKDARLVQLEKWLTMLYGHPFAEVCLDCPPSDKYFRAVRKTVGAGKHSFEAYVVEDACFGPVSVPIIRPGAAAVAVALALRGIGLDPRRVERYIQEGTEREFQIKEGSGFGRCLMGKEFLAAVEALLEQSTAPGSGSPK